MALTVFLIATECRQFLRRVPQKVPKVFYASDWFSTLQILGARELELVTATVSNLGPESDGAIPKESK
jgi:hypothetical protein